MMPLAERLRPKTLDEVVGQKHILSEDSVFKRVIQSGHLPNLIFYGPSGVGKTTVARIIAQNAGKTLHKLNGTTASTADIKAVVSELDTFSGQGGVVLYLDEIQYLNKKQQQTLLEFIEDGSITLIASTTENPYFAIYNAILSRSTVFEFKPVEPLEIAVALLRAVKILESENNQKIKIDKETIELLSKTSAGDVRKSLGALELAFYAAATTTDGLITITNEAVKQVAQRSNMRYDREGDEHYDILSAFQKSIRGSDENAALHYLARLLSAGDLLSPIRRLLVIAAEDIGLGFPAAISIVKACTDTAIQIGLPEAQIPLAQAVILLATAPKSNSAVNAIAKAMADIKNEEIGNIPPYLKDGSYGGAKKLGNAIGYQYPHSFKNNYIKQQYLPDSLAGRVYYDFGENKTEQAAKAYWEKIKGKDANS